MLLKNGFAYDNGHFHLSDVLIENGCIKKIAMDIPVDPKDQVIDDQVIDDQVIDVKGKYIIPGFVDMHVHFREPGFPNKETIRTGCMAAAKGGFTAVCTMPNLYPAPDSLKNLKAEQDIINRDAIIKVYPYGCITKGRLGKVPVDMKKMSGHVIALSDDGNSIQDESVMEQAMKQAKAAHMVIASHCEDARYKDTPEAEYMQVRRDLELCSKTGCRLHVCHVSTKESVDLIRQAKRIGVRVTCETTPHYLILCEDDVYDDGRFKVNPPIRKASDRDALIFGLLDGTIDIIATDHAPHTKDEKSKGFKGSVNGITGLDTAFAVLNTKLVLTKILSSEKIISLMSLKPRELFGIEGGMKEGKICDLAVIDKNAEYVIDPGSFASMGKSTPFEGMHVHGRNTMTICNGEIVWRYTD
ncbi:MAG: dihydroorotase [Clostridia bacterium]